MATLSSTAWIVHDLGLASSIGGSLFGKLAMHPSMTHVSSAQERDELADDAWRRFSLVNLLAHAAVLATWLPGRRMLSGREASRLARTLTVTKDVLVGASVASGLASIFAGRALARRVRRGAGPAQAERAQLAEAPRSTKLDHTVKWLGTVNLVCNIGVLGVTSLLAMQSSQSLRFAKAARRLP